MMHIVFGKSPLKEVLFQVNFPTLLIIDNEKPAAFQNRIYSIFPFYEENNSNVKELIIGPNFGEPQVNSSSIKNYIFVSIDQNSRVILNNSSLTITTKDYKNWNLFSEICFNVLNHFIEIYNPIFFNRIGLRYINVIEKSFYNLKDEQWNQLIKPEYLGPHLVKSDSRARIFNILSERYNKENNILVKEQYGLVKNELGEICFLADADYIMAKRIEVLNTKESFMSLHDNSENYIKNIASEKLLSLMEPKNE